MPKVLAQKLEPVKELPLIKPETITTKQNNFTSFKEKSLKINKNPIQKALNGPIDLNNFNFLKLY
jgi:hypothetical protein